MNNIIFFGLIGALSIYIIVRQFTEQQVTPISLLLLPLVSAYASYLDLQPAFMRFAPLPLIGGLAVGVLVGVAIGIFRGRNTRVRLESSSGIVYSKPQLPSSIMWLVLLIVRIGVIILTFSPLGHMLLVGIVIAFGGTVFLLSVSTQKWMVFTQYSRYRANAPA
jgi:hypothetical protein